LHIGFDFSVNFLQKAITRTTFNSSIIQTSGPLHPAIPPIRALRRAIRPIQAHLRVIPLIRALRRAIPSIRALRRNTLPTCRLRRNIRVTWGAPPADSPARRGRKRGRGSPRRGGGGTAATTSVEGQLRLATQVRASSFVLVHFFLL
jgi:hypothetical protein